ncbi:Ig-like domain-containing protein [uncultured Draconibacterium sp.]|uniref:Ig-like domain-containing protein n=1 Tax=uncultured Draconibacterium sp. TaxID=1573823 RepID=UPI002AA67FA2|nr:putative Ig domain-containing protein [uncultured Draconibacterium sp.]
MITIGAMKKVIQILIVIVIVVSTVQAQDPNWNVVGGLGHTMTLHAKIKVDGTFVTQEYSKLAAFKDGECRGVTSIFNGPSGMQFQLSIGSNDATEEGIRLKVYDKLTDSVYEVESSIDFGVNKTVGTIESPVIYFNKDLGTMLSDYLEVGKYKIYADKIVEVATSEYEIEGNIQINEYIKIESKLLVNVNELSVSGDGRIYLDKIPIVEIVDIYSGEFELELAEGINFKEYTSDKMSIMLSKLPVDVDQMFLIDGGVLIYGDLQLPEIIDKVDAHIQTLEITRQHGVRLLGTVSVEDIKIHSVTLDTLGLTFNTIDDYFSAAAHLTTPFFGVGATTEIISGKMNFVHIDVVPPHPIPVAATGFSISEISGGVDNLANPPLTLMVSIDLVPSAQGNFEVVKLNNLSLSYTWGKEFNGSGELQLFDNDLANVYLSIQKNKVAFGGAVSLYDIFNGKIDASIFKEGDLLIVNGRLYAALSIPAKDGFPFDILGSLVELPYVVAETDNYLSNNIIAGNTKLLHFKMNYKAEWKDKKLTTDYGRGYENWNEIIFGNSNLLKLKNATENRFEGQSLIINDRSTQSGLKSSGINYEQVFKLQEETPTMIIRVDQDNQMPQCQIRMPDGQVIGPNNVNNSNQFYSENDIEQKIFYQFDNPPVGDWAIIADNMNEDIKVDVIGAELGSALIIDSLGYQGSNVIVPYRAYTNDKVSRLTLFYDDDNTGFNGVKFSDFATQNENDELNWNTSEIPNGRYFVYGILEDEENTPIRIYSPNSVTITHDNTPDAPTNLQYMIENDTLRLIWDYEATANINFNVYYDNTLNFGNTTKSFNSGSQKYMVLPDLISGRDYYFAVTAIDEKNLESEYSETLKVSYDKKEVNNPPYISEIIVQNVVYIDSLLVGQIYANDTDGDNLSFLLKNEPEGMSINSEGILNWRPELDNIGVHSFSVIVSDENNAQDSSLVSVTVKNNLLELPELSSNKNIYTSLCDLPVINLTDGMLNTNENKIDSVRIGISNGGLVTDKFLYEQSLSSKSFSGIIDLEEFRNVLNIANVDTLILSYQNYSYQTKDSFQIIINDRLNVNLLNLEGSYIMDAGSRMNLSAVDGFETYEWYKEGESEPISLSKNYSITTGGSYYVKVIDEYGCFAISSPVTVAITDVNEISDENKIVVNYNLNRKELYVKLNGNSNPPYRLEVFNVVGQKVFSKIVRNYEEIVKMNSLTTGQYSVIITNDFEKVTTKFVNFE